MAVGSALPGPAQEYYHESLFRFVGLESAIRADQPDLANGETGVKMERFNGIDPTGIARARRALGVQKKRP
jgi:hypothetical protein